MRAFLKLVGLVMMFVCIAMYFFSDKNTAYLFWALMNSIAFVHNDIMQELEKRP